MNSLLPVILLMEVCDGASHVMMEVYGAASRMMTEVGG